MGRKRTTSTEKSKNQFVLEIDYKPFHLYDKKIIDEKFDNITHNTLNIFDELLRENQQKLSHKNSGDRIWEHIPVDITTFINDKYYLDIKDQIRPAIRDDLEQIFQGKPFHWRYREAIFNEAIGCVPAENEYLTQTGWKPIKDFTPNDKVATFHVDGSITFETPINYYKFPADEWYEFNRRCGIHQKLSPEHNVIYRNYKHEIKSITMVNLYEKHAKLRDGFQGKFITTFTPQRGFSLPDKFLKLLVAVQADATLAYPPTNYWQAEFKKPRKYLKFEKLLRENNIPFQKKRNVKRNTFTFSFKLQEGFKEFPSKFYQLNVECLKVIAEEVVFWDGSEKGKYYVTTSKHNADFIQYAFTSSGYRSSISITNSPKRKTTYNVFKTTDTLLTIKGSGHEKVAIDHYDAKPNEYKYCFETSTGMWVTRYNNKILVTGNTGKSYRMSIIALYIAYCCLCLRDPQRYFKLSKDTGIAIINMSITSKNAREKVFREIHNKCLRSPWFMENYPPKERSSDIEFDRLPRRHKDIEPDRIYKNIVIFPGSSSVTAPTGFEIICGIIDEATLYKVTDRQDTAQEIYETISTRITSRFDKKGLLVMGGSPNYVGDFLQRKELESQDDDEVFKKRRTLWESKYYDPAEGYFYFDHDSLSIVGYKKPVFDKDDNIIEYEVYDANNTGNFHNIFMNDIDDTLKPTVIEVPMALERTFKKYPIVGKRDLAGIALETLAPIFGSNTKVVDDMCNTEREVPVDAQNNLKEWFRKVDENGNLIDNSTLGKILDSMAYYTIHVDLGISGDACALAMGHLEPIDYDNGVLEPKIVIDLLWREQGDKYRPVIISEVRDLIYELSARGFKLYKVTYDGFQSVDSVQTLNAKGYWAETLSVDKSTKPYEYLIEYLVSGRLDYYPEPILIKELKNLELVRGGKKIDHPPMGCFTSETKIKLANGIEVTFGELAARGKINVFKVISYDIIQNKLIYTMAYNAHVTKKIGNLIKITFADDTTVECSPEHLFLLENGDGIRADMLFAGDKLLCIDKVISVKNIERITLQEPIDVYDITVPVYNNFALDNGVIVRNSKDLSDCVAGVVNNLCEMIDYYGETLFEPSSSSILM